MSKPIRRTLTPVHSGDAGYVPASVTFDQDPGRPPSNDERVPDVLTNGGPTVPFEGYDGLLTPETGTNTWNQHASHHRRPFQHQSPTGTTTLPPFIASLAARIPTEDLDFLVRKGAFTLPEPDMWIEIIRGYMLSVHPFMPMLDYRQFIRTIFDNREDDQISLLLFQAVMFAGVHSLPLAAIRKLGFDSTKQARHVFFHRARLLYEFDVDSDSATILQSVLLMSSWYSRWDDRRHTWHWTGAAYDIARSMGLHREPKGGHASDKLRHHRRRMWWSLYIRDRFITLGTRRPMRIQDHEFDVKMLTLEDFDLEPEDDHDEAQTIIPSGKERTSTALMCIQLAELCISIGRVVASQYTTLANSADVPHTMMVISKRDGSAGLEHCGQELNDWRQTLDEKVAVTDIPAKKHHSALQNEDPSHICSDVHWATLNMTYLTAVNVLHRAHALQPPPDTAEAQRMHKLSKAKVKDAARNLTKLSQTLLRKDQVRYLGLIGVTALVAACLSHMLDINSGDEDVRDASTFRLFQSLQVLESLAGIYASADAAVDFIASITRKAGISLPTQITATPLHVSTTSHNRSNSQTTIGRGARTRPHSSSEYLNGSSVAWPSNLIHGTPQAIHNHALSPQKVLDGDTHGIVEHSFGPAYEQGVPHFLDESPKGLSNTAITAPFLDWNNSVVDNSTFDPGPMAFNYDFYSDAFGFLDGNFQGV